MRLTSPFVMAGLRDPGRTIKVQATPSFGLVCRVGDQDPVTKLPCSIGSQRNHVLTQHPPPQTLAFGPFCSPSIPCHPSGRTDPSQKQRRGEGRGLYLKRVLPGAPEDSRRRRPSRGCTWKALTRSFRATNPSGFPVYTPRAKKNRGIERAGMRREGFFSWG